MTNKQKRFIEEYLIDFNATQSAIRAGYSVDTAKDIGCENLAKPNIKKAINKALAERSRRTGITQDRVIQELARIAFVNFNDIVNENGEIKSDASADDLACVESYKVENGDSINGSSSKREVKLASKMKALELLGKHLGMFSDKFDVNMNLPVIISGEDELEE